MDAAFLAVLLIRKLLSKLFCFWYKRFKNKQIFIMKEEGRKKLQVAGFGKKGFYVFGKMKSFGGYYRFRL